MDGNFAVIDVIDGDDLQHATRTVGADVEHAVDLVDVRFNWTGGHRVVDRLLDVRVSDPMAASAVLTSLGWMYHSILLPSGDATMSTNASRPRETTIRFTGRARGAATTPPLRYPVQPGRCGRVARGQRGRRWSSPRWVEGDLQQHGNSRHAATVRH